MVYSTMVKKIRLKAHRSITLIHLGILVAHKNSNKEDEWPNYEFYPGQSYRDFLKKNPNHGTNYVDNGRPFRFRMKISEILRDLYPGQEEQATAIDLVYKKKQLPNMNPKLATRDAAGGKLEGGQPTFGDIVKQETAFLNGRPVLSN